MPDILVVQLARLGDFLQSTPLLRGLKNERPDNRICVLVDSANRGVAERSGCADEVIAISVDKIIKSLEQKDDIESSYKELQSYFGDLLSRSFDTVINLNYSRAAAILSALPESKNIMGYHLNSDLKRLNKDSWFVFFNNMVKYFPLAPFNLVDCFYYLYFKKEAEKKICFELNKRDEMQGEMLWEELNISSDNKAIVVHPGIRNEKRSWPIGYFAGIIHRYLQKRDIDVILTGSSEDRLLSRRLFEMLDRTDRESDRLHDLIGKTSLHETAELLGRSDLLLCGDTGIMHLATAVGTKIFALFIGPASVYSTGPYCDGAMILQTVNECSPCVEDMHCEDKYCRYLIKPEIVFDLSLSYVEGADTYRMTGADTCLFTSKMDSWGVCYFPLSRNQPGKTGLMNSCYREIGKNLIDHGQRCRPCREGCEPVPGTAGYDTGNLISALSSGKKLLNKVYSDNEWIAEECLKDENRFWFPWIDAYLENRKYENRNSFEFIYALDQGLHFIDDFRMSR